MPITSRISAERPLERFRTSDGVGLAWTVDDFTDPWRETEPVVLLHAAMGNARRWYAWLPRLAWRHRVFRLELRGHGQSEPGATPLTIERLTADVREFLDHVGLSAPHVVGNSAGGYLAQRLALETPGRVRSLALYGSTPGLKHSHAATWIPQIAKKGLRPFLAETIHERFPKGADPRHVEWFLDQTGSNDPAFIARFVTLMTTLDWEDELPAIKCPTLIVAAGAETIGSGDAYQRMHERIAGSELLYYEGLPHNICDSAPERCVADLLSFLERRFG